MLLAQIKSLDWEINKQLSTHVKTNTVKKVEKKNLNASNQALIDLILIFLGFDLHLIVFTSYLFFCFFANCNFLNLPKFFFVFRMYFEFDSLLPFLSLDIVN